jgi:predicted nucleotidyltransferase
VTNQEFRALLLKYFRNGCLSKSNKLVSILVPSVPFKGNAKKISTCFKGVKDFSEDLETLTLQIENYSGVNIHAKKISEFLKVRIGKEIMGAYVHGSVATSEEVPYSDFDGFIILKNEVLSDPEKLKEVAVVLLRSEKIMFEMDPLQHHGWFILTENDLKNYPEYYFPHELFRYSKCLFGENKITIHLKKSGFKKEHLESFNRMAQGILKKLDSKNFLTNYYSFKNLLSECMLLPAFYIQAKTGNGIFKKFSFEKIKNELKEKYPVMDEISFLRSAWNYKPPAMYSFLRNKNNLLFNKLSVKHFSGKLPAELKNKFDESFINRMKDLVIELKSNLSE